MALEPQCIALSGGVGGAKLALGLSLELAADRLSVIVNTGDDFDHLGLRVCPDLDTLMYTLSGKANQELGWGQASETWSFLSALSDLGGEDWFKLGDRDLATHVLRTQMLGSGSSLTDATRALMTALGVKTVVLPMTDDRVATEIHCQSGETLAFQHYFVRDRCEPPISGVSFSGMESARRTTQFNALLEAEAPASVIICPSNPFVSVAPILDLQDTWRRLREQSGPVVAVSPIVAGMALKGPAAKMMQELDMPSTALAVAEFYQRVYPGLLQGFVIDHADEASADAVRRLGLEVLVTATVMKDVHDKQALARDVLAFVSDLTAL